MSLSALTLMLCTWATILGACGYCFFRLLMSDRHFGGDGHPKSSS